MIESIAENKNKSSNYESCRECGGTTLVWNGVWKICAQCNAVFAKRDLIADDKTISNDKTITDDKTIEHFIKDEVIPLKHTNKKQKSKGFYISYKTFIILIPVLYLGIYLIT